MHQFELRKISKRYRNRVVLKELNLHFRAGEITSLLGRSGSGKTTLGRILAGLIQPDSGDVVGLAGQRVMYLPQDFVIWPHLTVKKNVELGVSHKGDGKIVERCLDLFHLRSHATDRAEELSYGQQHRVALARSFAFGPRVLILDEPLAHLDEPLRRTVAREIAQVCQTEEVTTLWITHDPSEAFEVGQTIAVLDQGQIAQIGSAEEIYWNPATSTAAMLSGEVNVIQSGNGPFQRALVPGSCKIEMPPTPCPIVFRPESARLVKTSAPHGIRIARSVFAGAGYYHVCSEFDPAIRIYDANKLSLEDRYQIEFINKPWLSSPEGSLS